jgi:hypothetical protein
MEDISETIRSEPILVKHNLADANPFSSALTRRKRDSLLSEIETLRNGVIGISDAVAMKRDVSPLDAVYDTLAKNEKFDSGARVKFLSHKLRIKRKDDIRTDEDFQKTLYGLLRLNACSWVVDSLSEQKLSVALPDVLALYRVEGDLAVPLSDFAIASEIVPDSSQPACSSTVTQDCINWPDAVQFLGIHHSFHALKNQQVNNPEYSSFVDGLRDMVRDRDAMLRDLYSGRIRSGYSVIDWLRSAKSGAMTLFLLLLGGLDVFTVGVLEPGDGRWRWPKPVFAFHFARNRVGAGLATSFGKALSEGADTFERLAGTSELQFDTGKQWRDSLITVLHGSPGSRQLHVIPIDPLYFVSTILTEAVTLLENLRRTSLPWGGKQFSNPLPPTVGYLRYHGGEVYFLIWVLDILDKVVNGNQPKTSFGAETNAIKKVRDGLAGYTRKKKKEVWTLLDQWRKESSSSGYLKSKPVLSGSMLRAAMRDDAIAGTTDVPGRTERSVVSELNAKGGFESALPLIDALTDADLWGHFETVMTSHIGNDGAVWLGNSPTITYDNVVGRNVMRYHYLRRGYASALGI